jgi:hypothetical protein
MTEEQQAAVREPLSQLQMAYAREMQAPAGAVATPGGTPASDAPDAEAAPPDDEAERAKARSKIWTPPGT